MDKMGKLTYMTIFKSCNFNHLKHESLSILSPVSSICNSLFYYNNILLKKNIMNDHDKKF